MSKAQEVVLIGGPPVIYHSYIAAYPHLIPMPKCSGFSYDELTEMEKIKAG